MLQFFGCAIAIFVELLPSKICSTVDDTGWRVEDQSPFEFEVELKRDK